MKWAILGTGSVSRKFCLGLAALGDTASVGAVASRNPDNARAFTTTLGLGQAVETYEAAVQSPDTERNLVAAMRRGSKMVVKGRNNEGTETTDVYSLSGITAALKYVSQNCN